MKCIFTCCLFFFSCAFLSAQLPPWNAKFVVYHPDGYTDTLWVGCDENATNGYDEGLDSLDNSFEYPISIGAFSPEVDAEFGLDNCVNLKRDIRPFGYPTEFTFYIVHDELETLEYAMIGWDTLDFSYKYDSIQLTSSVLTSYLGYILGIDNSFYVIMSQDGSNDSVFNFNYQPIAIYPEANAYECEPINYTIKVKLSVFFEDLTVSIINNNEFELVRVYPNPVINKLVITNDHSENITVYIYNYLGIKNMEFKLLRNQIYSLDVQHLAAGSYKLVFFNEENIIVNFQTIIKL